MDYKPVTKKIAKSENIVWSQPFHERVCSYIQTAVRMFRVRSMEPDKTYTSTAEIPHHARWFYRITDDVEACLVKPNGDGRVFIVACTKKTFRIWDSRVFSPPGSEDLPLLATPVAVDEIESSEWSREDLVKLIPRNRANRSEAYDVLHFSKDLSAASTLPKKPRGPKIQSADLVAAAKSMGSVVTVFHGTVVTPRGKKKVLGMRDQWRTWWVQV